MEVDAWQNLGINSSSYPTWLYEAIDKGTIQIDGEDCALVGPGPDGKSHRIPISRGDWIVKPNGSQDILLAKDESFKLNFELMEPNSATTPCHTPDGRKRSWKDLLNRYLRKGRN